MYLLEGKNSEDNCDRGGMIDPEEVQVSRSIGEDPARNASEIHDETGRAETPGCMKRLRSSWQPVLIAILMVVIFALIGVFFSGKNEKQSLEAKLQHMEEENIQLKAALNQSLHNITMTSAENKRLQLMLASEQQTTAQLETKNQQQRSILFSNKLSFVWTLCNNDTLECSRCLPGWEEHASRCFFLSTVAKKWENARWDCFGMGGDLAIVLTAEDQAFLTNMTFQYTQQHPQEQFHSAWIGLQDMVREGIHYWGNGNRVHQDVEYWRPLEPNNAIASWDTDKAGQDCVAIVPPDEIGTEDWLNSWDDVVCLGARHYICETMAFIVS